MSKFVIVVAMRLNKQQFEHLAFLIVKGMMKDNFIITENRDKTDVRLFALPAAAPKTDGRIPDLGREPDPDIQVFTVFQAVSVGNPIGIETIIRPERRICRKGDAEEVDRIGDPS